MKSFYILTVAALIASACSGNSNKGWKPQALVNDRAQLFEITDGAVVSVSPWTGERDTVRIDKKVESIVCFSTSYVAYLSAIGCQGIVRGVSGIDYLTDKSVKAVDVGYDSAPDYERIISLQPDLVAVYSLSGSEAPYIAKLKSLGLKVLEINDQMEQHPLARAEYVRLFGALTGKTAEADSAYNAVRTSYLQAVSDVDDSLRPEVLMNAPYSDQWFVPGGESYMSCLVHDAGGKIAGAQEGKTESSVISIEKAYSLSQDVDFWLHPGSYSSRAELEKAMPLFAGIPYIYNNTLRANSKGGNDFWESGAFRCDLILRDLKSILSGKPESLNYYIEVK